MGRQYCTISFLQDNTLEIVPAIWLFKSGNGMKCHWPPDDFVNAVRIKKQASKSWKSYACKVVRWYDSLEEAEYAFDEILCQAELCTATEASDVENGVVSSPEYLVLNRTRGIKRSIPKSSDDELPEISPVKKKKSPKKKLPMPPTISPPSSQQRIGVGNMDATSAVRVGAPQGLTPSSSNQQSGSRDLCMLQGAANVASPRSGGRMPRRCTSVDGTLNVDNRSLVASQSSASPRSSTRLQSTSQGHLSSVTALHDQQHTGAIDNESSVRSSNHVRRALLTKSTPNINGSFASSVTVPLSALNTKFLTLLEEIRMNSHTTISLLQHLINSNKDQDQFDLDFSNRLPVCSLQELELLDTDSKSPDIRGRLVRYLGVAGGKDTGDSTRSVLVRLMKATVARSCNWAGKGGKTAFGQMNLHSIVCEAVRRNPVTCRSTDKDISETIKVWLKHAKDRLGGKARR